MSHSFLPPSGASAWQRCAMWPTMNAQFPQGNTPESLEGTAAHFVAWEMKAGRTLSVGSQTPNGQTVTDEMLDGAVMLLEVIAQRCSGRIGHTEEPIAIPEISAVSFGTPDFWDFRIENNHLEVIDYKFGHRFVDEYLNPQGLCYVSGIISALLAQLLGDAANISVSFTIVQPRCFYKGAPVRTHSYSWGNAFIQAEIAKLRNAAAAALSPELSKTATVNDACIHCPGRHACSALQHAAYDAAGFSTDVVPLQISPQAAAVELFMLERAAAVLEARIDGLRELTTANIQLGERVRMYQLVPTQTRVKWTKPVDEILALGEMFGKDLRKPVDVITPAQAKKLIDGTVINEYASSQPGALKLQQITEKDIRKIFDR